MIEKALFDRVRLGLIVGLAYAGAYSLVAVAVFHFKDPADLAMLHASLTQVVLAYIVGAVAGGAIVGALLPIARWPAGAFALGTAGTFPFFVLVFLLLAADAPWFPDQVVMGLIGAMLLGGPMGLFIRGNS
jgi:MFS family permease